MILHRWEYDPLLFLWRCVEPEIPVNSDRCIGCGMIITQKEFYEFWRGENPGCCVSATLNYMAFLKNWRPQNAGV